MAENTDQQQEIKKEKPQKALFDEREARLVAEQKHQFNAEKEQEVSKCDGMTPTEDDEEFGATAVEPKQIAEYPEPTSNGTTGASITSSLRVKIEDLVNRQSVEGQRLEFKESWNNGPTKLQVIQTISAFANDFYNDNGGYIVIGVAEPKKDKSEKVGESEKDKSEEAIVLPPRGINPKESELIQKQILGACTSFIRPSYSPILSPEYLQGKLLLVIWAKRSHDGPHRARVSENGGYDHFIRKGPRTTKANDKEIKSLHENSSRIPFDNRMAKPESGKRISIDAIHYELVKAFFNEINNQEESGNVEYVLQKWNLVVPDGDASINGVLKPVFVPRNVALLMFNRSPHQYFPAARIKVAQKTRDDKVIFENEFTGPLQSQIIKSMDCVHSTTDNIYPREAVLETIVNAVYHRGYEPEDSGPTEVLILPNSLEIISFPGPPSNLKQEDFSSGSEIPVAQVKNQRIGEFLSKLGLAKSWRTGVQKIFNAMKRNQNPIPKFIFDSGHFHVILPAPHKFQAENENESELGNAGEMTQNEKEALIGSIQAKDSLITKLKDQVRDLERDVRKTKDELERTTEEKSVATSEVERLKEMCNKLVEQVNGLISQQEESEAERRSLLQLISDLRDEIEVLHVAGKSTGTPDSLK